jgi:hypothetical protein
LVADGHIVEAMCDNEHRLLASHLPSSSPPQTVTIPLTKRIKAGRDEGHHEQGGRARRQGSGACAVHEECGVDREDEAPELGCSRTIQVRRAFVECHYLLLPSTHAPMYSHMSEQRRSLASRAAPARHLVMVLTARTCLATIQVSVGAARHAGLAPHLREESARQAQQLPLPNA